MKTLLAIRTVFFGLFLLPLAAMVFAVVYLQQTLGLPPCPLCVTQRGFVILVGLFALLAAVGGGAVAGRHVWLQHLPPELTPACGPSLSYMLETLPLSETLQLVMMGDGNCAETVWTLLGLSIPEQTLALFAVLAAIALLQLLRGRP